MALAALFYETVHAVNARDYTPQQLDAWATGEVDLDAWDRSFQEHDTVIAEQNGSIVGFGDMDASGYLDRLYVHKDCQGQGVASAICAWLERRSAAAEYITHASLTARPFLERRGWQAGREQEVERRGVWLKNVVMRKRRPEATEKEKVCSCCTSDVIDHRPGAMPIWGKRRCPSGQTPSSFSPAIPGAARPRP